MNEAADMDLGRETALGTVASAVMMIGGFLGTILFARILGPSSFGGVYLLMALVKIADRPMSGWAAATKKRVSESSDQLGAALGAQLLFNAGWVVIVGGVILLVFADSLREYTGLEAAPILFVVLLATASTYETLERLVQALGRISTATWIDTLRSYLTLPLQLALVLVGLGASGMVLGLASASVLVIPVVGYLLSARPVIPSTAMLRQYWAFARYSIPTSALGTVYDRLDVLLLGLVLSPAAAGHYEVAWKLTLPAMFVAQTAASGLMVKVSGLDAQGRDVVEDIKNTISFSSVIALPLFVGAAILSTDVVRVLYGREYLAAAPLLVGIAGFRVVRTQSGPLLHAVDGLDYPGKTMRLSALALAVNVVLGVALTLTVGPLGVVIATIAAESVRYAGVLYFLRTELPTFNPLTRPFFEQSGASLVMLAVVAVANWALPNTGVTSLILVVGVGAVTYSVVLLTVSSRLRVTLRSAFPYEVR